MAGPRHARGPAVSRAGAHSKGPVLGGGKDRPEQEDTIVTVVVRDNNVDQALRALKKKMQREGMFREIKRRKYYEKPSERRAREASEAQRRLRKLQRKRAQREGLI